MSRKDVTTKPRLVKRKEVGALTHKIDMYPAYDLRHKNCGIHGVELNMTVIGEAGAIQFVLFTGWHLPHVRDELKPASLAPTPADLCYHSKAERRDWDSMHPDCVYTGGLCYAAGSALQAREVFELLVLEGSAAVWTFLEKRYHETFDAATPLPCEGVAVAPSPSEDTAVAAWDEVNAALKVVEKAGWIDECGGILRPPRPLPPRGEGK